MAAVSLRSDYSRHVRAPYLGVRHQMDIISLLGKKLKSVTINDLFEMYNVDVSYQYDRLEENVADNYSASIGELGLEFSFNTEQVLQTIFITSENSFEKINWFRSIREVENYCHENALIFEKRTSKFLGVFREWIKLYNFNCSIHYEFQDSTLRMVTLEAVGA
ncbi:hypothetical protein [Alteromonas sp. S167]|uniref:hypothetical protein n=1 Tax=Alteromonas sp. S167 TaxID=3117402 RepID=UPI002FE1A417